MTREVLISVPRPGEYWVAVLQDGRPEQVYVEQDQSTVGNIYKGRIVHIEPAIQAAFLDYGVGRNGFLHVTDVEPAYYRHLNPPAGPGHPKPLIQDIFRRGQEVLVQVIKEGVENKGAILSTYISIAARYAVLLPFLDRVGISRKVDEEQRRQLWEVLRQVRVPVGLGFILRAAAAGQGADEVQADLDYLARLWRVLNCRIRTLKPPAEVYLESNAIARTLRDNITGDTDSVIVDQPNAFEHIRESLEVLMPGQGGRVVLHEGQEPLFHKYGIHDESMQRPVTPRSGAEPHRAD
jgi:ribonuclease E